jgi:hypothetical protein
MGEQFVVKKKLSQNEGKKMEREVRAAMGL